jgi:hypothetical protein
MPNGSAILWLFVLAIPVACISWTFVFEEIFREVHEYLVQKGKKAKGLFARKFFFLLTCEYCFSHYITIFILFLTGFKLFLNDWRGYLIAGFSIVWVANFYMSLFALLRQGIKKEKTEIKLLETEIPEVKPEPKINRRVRREPQKVRRENIKGRRTT